MGRVTRRPTVTGEGLQDRRFFPVRETSKGATPDHRWQPPTVYRIVSLFSGAGGLDLGFALTGRFEVSLAVEILKPPAETFSKNFNLPLRESKNLSASPAVILGDVENLDFSTLEGEPIDLLIGGPPCQDFSIVRGPEWDRRGIEAPRGKLYRHFIRALVLLQPKAFVFENVKGLLSSNGGAAYRTILEDFEAVGWQVVFAGNLNAADFGVPQARERLFIVGIRKDLLGRTSVDRIQRAFVQGLRERSRSFPQYPLTPLEAFEGQPLPALEDRYREIMAEYEDLLGKRRWNVIDDYLKANSAHPKGVALAFKEHEEILKELGFLGKRVTDLEVKDGSTRLLRETDRVLERMRQIPPGKNCEVVRGTEWEVEGRGISLIYRRLHPLKPAYTIVAYGGGGTWGYHYERKRSKLTHRERARLQSFPDWFEFWGSSGEVRAQIGEAVPPLLAKRIAEACLEILF